MAARERLRLIKALVVTWIDVWVGGDIVSAEQIMLIIRRMVRLYAAEKLAEMQ